jgi:predicted neutral ceramidase superfamily lipid hydrolase
MTGNGKNNKRFGVSEETMHKWIVPIMHGSLWFFGLFMTKYSAQLLGVDQSKENVVNMLNVFPAFLVFIFEMAVSFRDIRVYKKTGKRLDVGITTFLSRFITVIGIVILFGILYAIKPEADFLFILLMFFSVVLKFMEYYLLNNIDSYFEKKPIEIKGPVEPPVIGYFHGSRK